MTHDEFVEDYGIDSEQFEKLSDLTTDEMRDMALAYIKSADNYKLTQILGLCREIFFDWEAE